MKRALLIFALLGVGILAAGTLRNPNFWRTAEQRGDALSNARNFQEAAEIYTDPAHIGVAQYRAGEFEAAAKTFARVPGAIGAFNQGNAWLLRGNYDRAVHSYDRALGFQPGWKEAEENKALALARKLKLEAAGENRDEEQADAYAPDKIVFDQKGGDRRQKSIDLAEQGMSDEELRATWLRGVRTTPGDFLRAKFAWEASHDASPKQEGGPR